MDFLIHLLIIIINYIVKIRSQIIILLPSTDIISLSDPISIFLFLNCDGGTGAVRKSSNAIYDIY